MRDYGKVFSRIWESPDFRALSEDGRSLVLYLLTCQHGTIAGVFRVPDGYACEDLQWDAERVAEGFRNLEERGFATRCEATKWVWVRKYLEWNPPENPNQRKAAVKCAAAIPDTCAWKVHFTRECGPLIGLEVPQEAKGSLTLAKPLLNQEQEQEQEKDIEAKTSGSSPKPPDVPHQAVIDLYHELLPSARRIRDWTPSRAALLRARWREDVKRQDLDWWRRFFAYVAESDFLMGRTQSQGRKPFEASLDWLLEQRNFVKVREGAYHERQEAA